MDNTPVTKDELKSALTEAVREIKEYIDERTHDAETRLLRAFSDYQTAHEVRFRKMKADVGNIDTSTDQRLTALEERILNMDKRLIEKGI